MIAPPVIGAPGGWQPGRFFAAGDSVSQTLDLPAGRWNLSLVYNSPVPLTVSGPGLHKVLPPSYDGKIPTFEGTGPYWATGAVNGGQPTRITVTAGGLDGIQRLLGVQRRIALGTIAATSASPEKTVPLASACGRFVDWYVLSS